MIRYLLIILLFTGCFTENRARKQFAKAAIAFPKIPADYCANEFPVTGNNKTDTINTIDSSAYKEVIKILQGAQDWYNKANDSIAKLIADLEAKIPGIDTICSKYAAAISVLKKQNLDLIYRLQHIDPIFKETIIRDTIPDLAAIRACEIDKSKLITLTETQAAEIKKYRGKANTRGYIMWGLIAFLILVIGANIWWKAKKITF